MLLVQLLGAMVLGMALTAVGHWYWTRREKRRHDAAWLDVKELLARKAKQAAEARFDSKEELRAKLELEHEKLLRESKGGSVDGLRGFIRSRTNRGKEI